MSRAEHSDPALAGARRQWSRAERGHVCGWCGKLFCDHADAVFAGVVTLDHGDGVTRDGSATS